MSARRPLEISITEEGIEEKNGMEWNPKKSWHWKKIAERNQERTEVIWRGTSIEAAVNDTSDHGIMNYIDTNAKCRHQKKFTCKGTLRQVFICPIPPPPRSHTVYVYVNSHREGGDGERTREKVSRATVHKAGSKIPTWLKLNESLVYNSDKHLPQSPFTCKCFKMTPFCFGVHIVN